MAIYQNVFSVISLCSIIFKISGESCTTNFQGGDLETLIPFLISIHSRSKDETRLKVPNFILELSRRSNRKENRVEFREGRPLITGHDQSNLISMKLLLLFYLLVKFFFNDAAFLLLFYLLFKSFSFIIIFFCFLKRGFNGNIDLIVAHRLTV